MFSYYSKAFASKGNHTLDQLRENIENSYEDRVDDIKPTTQLNDENWAIEFWMRPYMLGLHYLAEYHGFRIARYHELGKEQESEESEESSPPDSISEDPTEEDLKHCKVS